MTAVCGREEDIITKTIDKNTTPLKLNTLVLYKEANGSHKLTAPNTLLLWGFDEMWQMEAESEHYMLCAMPILQWICMQVSSLLLHLKYMYRFKIDSSENTKTVASSLEPVQLYPTLIPRLRREPENADLKSYSFSQHTNCCTQHPLGQMQNP